MAAKEFSYDIVEEIGTISTSTSGWNREVNIVRWNEGKPKLDIRDWAPDHSKMGKGISLTSEEVALLRVILDEFETDKL